MSVAAPSLLAVSLPLLIIVGAIFIFPGARFASWLMRSREEFFRPAQLALGFAISFAVFGLLSWPFLWYRRSVDEFLHLLYPTWTLFVAASWFLPRWLPRNFQQITPVEALHAPRSFTTHQLAKLSRKQQVALAGYALLSLALIYVYALVPSLRSILLILSPLILVPGFLIARSLRGISTSLFHYDADDHAAPPRLWTYVAATAVALQVLCIASFNRPDWDDCYYLAAALDYQHAQVLNSEEPSHREGLPVPTQHRTLCWELFGAVLCRLTGVSPLALFHTFLPVVLLLLSYAAYTALLRELLPRRWVPLGILALSALHVWGISSHASAANFLLPRLGQAKAVLLHLATPLCAALLLRYAARPSRRVWAALVGTIIFGLFLSLSAIFMLLAVVFCLGVALAVVQPSLRDRLRILFAAGLSTLPLLIAGVLMRVAMRKEVGLHARPAGSSEWVETVRNFVGIGASELLWLSALPIVAALLRDNRARAYLLGLPVVLFATLANPLLFHPVATSLTSYHTYTRLLWLLPIGPTLAVLLALTCRLVWRRNKRAEHRPLFVGLAIVLCSLALPGMYVFGSRNSFIGVLGEPSLAHNVEKLPRDLLPIAARLAAVPRISESRILCNEQIASFLTPYSRELRFVQTRSLYTPVLFSAGARTDEGIERALLATILRRGSISQMPTADDWMELYVLFGKDGVEENFGAAIRKADRDVQRLITRYRVHYAITGPGDHADTILSQNGYIRLETHGDFTLWQRGNEPAQIGAPRRLPAGGEADERSESVGWKVFGLESRRAN